MLIHHKFFEFESPNFKPSKEYQYCRLHMVYDVKLDLTHKASLTCDDSRVDSRGLSTRATVVNVIYVRLLDINIDSQNFKIMTGDIGNAFIPVLAREKIYTQCGPEFGDRAGVITIIFRALYSLTTSAERFRTMMVDFLRTLEFNPSRFDRDV